ncbi:formate dehydrogenase subunit delta [Alsobacter sp. R-9]
MTTDRMVHMANQIAAFFRSYPHDTAVEGIAGHIRQFWARPMREQLFAHVDAGGQGLEGLVVEAVQRLRVGA